MVSSRAFRGNNDKFQAVEAREIRSLELTSVWIPFSIRFDQLDDPPGKLSSICS